MHPLGKEEKDHAQTGQQLHMRPIADSAQYMWADDNTCEQISDDQRHLYASRNESPQPSGDNSKDNINQQCNINLHAFNPFVTNRAPRMIGARFIRSMGIPTLPISGYSTTASVNLGAVDGDKHVP